MFPLSTLESNDASSIKSLTFGPLLLYSGPPALLFVVGFRGLMWAAFHVLKWWDVLNLAPMTLGLAWSCARRKSTTPGIVIHGITDGAALIPLIAGVLGIVG